MRPIHNILAATIALLGAMASTFAAGPSAPPAPAAPAPATQLPLLTPDLKSQFWFGVAVENIPPPIARQLKLKPSQGLMVSAVLPDSPAEKAGIKTDDILIEINNHPLTSQDDLFRAANSVTHAKTEIIAQPSRLVYLREGDRISVDIIPAPRPQNMIVFDGGGAAGGGQPHNIKVRNYVAPSGGAAQVGTGYRINLAASDPADFTAKSIRAIVSKGQTVILSQETDVQGNVKNTITVGTTVYTVDPLHLDALPADLRPLAQQLINGSPATAAATTTAPAPSLEQRVKDLETQNAELRRQVEGLLHSKH